jgi:hypothetical protein
MSGSLLFYAYPYSVYATVLFVFSLQSLAAQHPILPDTQMPQSYRLSRACLGKLNEWMSLCSRPLGIKVDRVLELRVPALDLIGMETLLIKYST